MAPLRLILSTCPEEHAKRLAQLLVERRLAACVNILPKLESVYRWDNELVYETESLLLIKTSDDKQAELFRQLQAEHPYAVPEIISLPSEQVLPDYLRWVQEETRDDSNPHTA